VFGMKNQAKDTNYNYGLPKGFVLDYDIISLDAALDKSRNKPNKQTLQQDFNKYINEQQLDIDCQELAKELIGLPKKPLKYQLSFIVFKVLKRDELDKLMETYPDKYMPPISKGSIEQRVDYYRMHSMVVNSPRWKKQIEINIKLYFSKNKYKKPVPILIKYGRCGCYTKTILDNEYDKNHHGSWFQHSPWYDEDIHRVLAHSPVRLGHDLKMTEFLITAVRKVNEYAQKKLFAIEEVLDMWQYFVTVNLFLRQNSYVEPEFIKKYFNPKIEKFRKTKTLVNFFYLENYALFLQELEHREIINRCKGCHVAFDYDKKKRYCTDKCAKSARNSRSYERNRATRLVKARRSTRALRKFYKERGVIKNPISVSAY